MRPGDIVAGIGCRAGVSAEDVVAALRDAEARAETRASAMAIPAFKSRERGLTEAATLMGIALILIDDAALAAVQSLCPTRSDRVAAQTGHASIAEAAAFAACGPGATLRLARLAHASVTCALVERQGTSA